MTSTSPKWGDLIKLRSDGMDALPDSEVPYYIGASDGLFLHRRLLIGRGAVKQSHWPDNWAKLGTSTGVFHFEAPPLPGKLISQVVDFFRRTYHRLHAEAAVLLTFNPDDQQWGIYIPTQLVSHGGVNYVYDPTTIKRPRYVVGSIHSHCNFSPFHSETDTGDADEFDGLHMTIGFIEKERPGIVAMIAMNKTKMHYADKDFPNIFDYEQLGQHTAPDWWDQYVGAPSEKPVGFELYKKFEKPTAIKAERQTTPSSGPPAHWGSGFIPTIGFSGVNRAAVGSVNGAGSITKKDDLPGFKEIRPGVWARDYTSPLTQESVEFNARKAAERGLKWTKDGELDLHQAGLKITDVTPEEIALLKELDQDEDPLSGMYGLPEDLLDALFDMNVLTDSDFEWAALNENAAGRISEWREILTKKLFNIVLLLREMGQTVDVDFGPKPPADLQVELLPSGSKPSEEMYGVH